MNVILGAWGLGADLGIPSRFSLGLTQTSGLPPMSAKHIGCVELFPFLLFDHVFIDENSYSCLVKNKGVWGALISKTGRELLVELHREGILIKVDYIGLLKAELDKIHDEAQGLLSSNNLDKLLLNSRLLWAKFLEGEGGNFHPVKEKELNGTYEEIASLRKILPLSEVKNRCNHDVYDVIAMLVLADKLNAAVYDWQMYRPFYDAIITNKLQQVTNAISGEVNFLHENLDIYIPIPDLPDIENLLMSRESNVIKSFREYTNFLERHNDSYSVKEFVKLRKNLLQMSQGALSRVNVFPSFTNRPPAFSEEIIKDIVRVEIESKLKKFENNQTSVFQFFQHIGGGLAMGDTYNAGQVGAQGPNAYAHDMNFTQIWEQSKKDIDLPSLANELEILRNYLHKSAESAEQHSEIGIIANAEIEAKRGDGAKTFEWLSKAGKWTLNVTEKIGVRVVTASIKNALGI